MKEDYLWDKTGQDFEIERLENALMAFRYQETAPPALPAKIIPFEKKNRWSFFRLSFASAAFAAFMFVCLGVWFQFSNKKIEVAKDFSQTQKTETAKVLTDKIALPIDKKVSDEIPFKKSGEVMVDKVATPKQSIKRNIVKIRKSVPTNAQPNNLIARNIEAKKPEVKLTKEEKYAYDQLMLALSITSSKLKLVSEKVSGGEE
jgi:hypothetical protein